MSRFLPPAIAVVALIASGTAHGLLTNRWAPSGELEASIARLAAVPTRVGAWEGRDETIDDRTLAQAGIDGYVLRRYRHAGSGEEVSVLLVTGLPGPISSHSPEICYRGAGYELAGAPQRYRPAGDRDAEFWFGRFRRPDAVAAGAMNILWAWGSAGGWAAPKEPRLKYLSARSLYKLYIICDSGDEVVGDPGPGHAGDEFAREFLGHVRDILFAPA